MPVGHRPLSDWAVSLKDCQIKSMLRTFGSAPPEGDAACATIPSLDYDPQAVHIAALATPGSVCAGKAPGHKPTLQCWISAGAKR